MRSSFIYNRIILILILNFIFLPNAYPSSLNPKAVGMGGAYTALASGFESAQWNPANLGLSGRNKVSVNLFSIGAAIKNNSLSISDYNKYAGKLLNEEDRENIINSIPAGGMALDVGAEFSAFEFSFGQFAVTQRMAGTSGFCIDRDPLKLMFLGNAVFKDVEVSDTEGESYALADLALSYGQSLKKWHGGEVTIGGSLHYLRGLAYAKIVEAKGGVANTDTGFSGDGYMRIRTSLGGNGYAVSIGSALNFERNWLISAAVHNIAGKMNWSRENDEYLTWFELEPTTLEEYFLSGQNDSIVTTGDSTYLSPQFASKPPPYLLLGIAREYGDLTYTFDWHQAFFESPGTNVNPKFAAGLEYRYLPNIPLRTGFSFGAGQGTSYSLGFGIYSGAFHIDYAIANSGSPIPAQSKGLKMALSISLFLNPNKVK